MRATVHYRSGEFDEGFRLAQQAAADAKRLRHGFVLLPMAMVAFGLVILGRRSEARAAMSEFFRLSRAADWWMFNQNDEACALLAMQENRHEAAARLLGYSRHKGRPAVDVALAGAQTALVRAQLESMLGAARLEQLSNEGALLDQEGVCALTLEEPTVAEG